MANVFLDAQVYANVMLLLLKNQLIMAKLIDTRFINQVNDENGLIINVKRPPRFIDKKSGTSAALATQDILTGAVPITVDQYSKVHLGIGDLEQVQHFNDLMKNSSMMSAATTLATSIDVFLETFTLQFNSWVGTPGNLIATPAMFNAAHTQLMANGVPNSDLNGAVLFADGAAIRGSLLANFVPPDMNRDNLEKVRIPIVSEVNLYATQNTPTLVTGTRTTSGAVTVNGAAQNVNARTVVGPQSQSFSIGGLTVGWTIAAGEVSTIAGVFDYDPRSGQALSNLKQFVVTTAFTAGAATGTITIAPAIIVPGTSDGVSTDANTAYATVNSAPANGAAITFLGAASTGYKQRAAFHRQSIAMVSAKLPTPFTGECSFATDPDTGITVRYWRGSDITTGSHYHRWDCVYGAAMMDRNMGVRINGT